MDAFSVLADQHAQQSRHDLAFSALPDAPVLPYTEPRQLLEGLEISGCWPRIRWKPHASPDDLDKDQTSSPPTSKTDFVASIEDRTAPILLGPKRPQLVAAIRAG